MQKITENFNTLNLPPRKSQKKFSTLNDDRRQRDSDEEETNP